MVTVVASRLIMLVFGTLYPAYSSYKAMKTKNVREYVRWMMYWIVFALFITAEVFADLLIGFWFPFYYEIKILFMLWLLSPATKGSSILYRKFVHPWLAKHEKDIDSYISQAKESGYDTFVRVSRNTISIAADTMVKTAVTGQNVLAEKLRQYGTDGTDGRDWKEGRMRKAKSWYGGMDSADFDYDPVDETDEPIGEETDERPSSPDAESLKLREELRETPREAKTRSGERESPGKQKYTTLPRSYGMQTHRSSSYSRLYEEDPEYDPQMTKSQSGARTRTYESSTLPRRYEVGLHGTGGHKTRTDMETKQLGVGFSTDEQY